MDDKKDLFFKCVSKILSLYMPCGEYIQISRVGKVKRGNMSMASYAQESRIIMQHDLI
jgi:hypothetical protein